MPIIDLMRERRSVRSYKPDPLSEEQIKAIIEAGCLAPSAHNGQPWNFVVITNREVINRLSLSAQGFLKENAETEERRKQLEERFAGGNDGVFYGAPCLILICTEKGNEYAPMDAGIAAQNMCLYAQEQGIGSCYIGYARHCEREELLKAGMKESQELQFGLVFGYSEDMEGKGLVRDFDKVQEWIR